MKTYLPYYFKRIGITCVVVAFVLSMIANFNANANSFIEGWNAASGHSNEELLVHKDLRLVSDSYSKLLNGITVALSLAGFLMYMFSKEEEEDELIQKFRYMSLARSLLFTWIVASLFIIINRDFKLEAIDILQFQMILYVLIYRYYRKYKFA